LRIREPERPGNIRQAMDGRGGVPAGCVADLFEEACRDCDVHRVTLACLSNSPTVQEDYTMNTLHISIKMSGTGDRVRHAETGEEGTAPEYTHDAPFALASSGSDGRGKGGEPVDPRGGNYP